MADANHQTGPSPALSQLVQHVDGFDTAYRAGHMHYMTKVIITT